MSTGIQQPTQQVATGDTEKKERMQLMLYALGGALKGDKDFVESTMKIKKMKEGKKKQQEQKKKYEDFLKTIPEGSFKELAQAIGPEKLDDLLLKRYEAEQAAINKKITKSDIEAGLITKILQGQELTEDEREALDELQRLDPIEQRIRKAMGGQPQ